ncbi:MAG: type I-G CRISPR-associated protein, Cas3-extension family [Candidatus Methylumidiphilus sp.]
MVELTGLSITNPQAVMASFGLLRVLAQNGQPQARLEWREPDRVAVIHGIDWDMLLETLNAAIQQREQAPELNWADSIKKYPREQYREQMQTCPPEQRQWLEAFWFEQHQKGKTEKGKTELTETKFKMTAAKQGLFSAVRKLIPKLRKHFKEKMGEALLGPWLNKDNAVTLGWDPGAMKAGSTYAGEKSPSDAKHITVIGAMWLAFEALPLFPARWLEETGRYDEIEWVVPHCPIGLAGLRQMLLAGGKLEASELEAQGWSRWSIAISHNGSFGCLQPAIEASQRSPDGAALRRNPGWT